jgi:hypothetical protein
MMREIHCCTGSAVCTEDCAASDAKHNAAVKPLASHLDCNIGTTDGYSKRRLALETHAAKIRS